MEIFRNISKEKRCIFFSGSMWIKCSDFLSKLTHWKSEIPLQNWSQKGCPFCLPWVCWCFPLLWNWNLSQSTSTLSTKSHQICAKSTTLAICMDHGLDRTRCVEHGSCHGSCHGWHMDHMGSPWAHGIPWARGNLVWSSLCIFEPSCSNSTLHLATENPHGDRHGNQKM